MIGRRKEDQHFILVPKLGFLEGPRDTNEVHTHVDIARHMYAGDPDKSTMRPGGEEEPRDADFGELFLQFLAAGSVF